MNESACPSGTVSTMTSIRFHSPDSALNDGDELAGEHDCSLYPFEIAALQALHQAVPQ